MVTAIRRSGRRVSQHTVATSPAALGFTHIVSEYNVMSNASRCATYQARQKALFAELERRVEQLEMRNKTLSDKFERLRVLKMDECIVIPHLGGVQ
jgi:hypothetical protein